MRLWMLLFVICFQLSKTSRERPKTTGKTKPDHNHEEVELFLKYQLLKNLLTGSNETGRYFLIIYVPAC